MISPQLAVGLLGGFAVILALFGGSSRADPVQIAFLRPLAALFLIPAFYWFNKEAFRQAPAVVLLLVAWTFWTALQLIPLSPAIWQGLPDRQILAELDQLTGLGGHWRPISLAPMRGMNALTSLVVPIAALLLALAFRSTSRLLLHCILAIGLANAGLALLQVLIGPSSSLYLYSHISPRAAAGLFANENHSAVFSVVVLLIIARLTVEGELMVGSARAWARIAYPAAFIFVLLMVLVTGSRAGLGCLIAALAACGWMALRANRSRPRVEENREGASVPKRRAGIWLAVLFANLAVVLIGVFFWLERTPALQDALERSAFDDLRWSILPVLTEMARVHWVWGTGLGSFDAVYPIYEPTELLLPAYVNQAHNDWLQVIIEGGLPGSLILAALMVWILNALRKIRLHGDTAIGRVRLVFWIAVIAILAAASVVDYPLRTPLFQAVAIWLLVCLACDQNETKAS